MTKPGGPDGGRIDHGGQREPQSPFPAAVDLAERTEAVWFLTMRCGGCKPRSLPSPRSFGPTGRNATTSGPAGGSRWQKARRAFLAGHPLCVACKAAGRVVVASVVDHVIPHRGDAALFWDVHNWQALCASCHARKTATEDGGFGHGAPAAVEAPGRGGKIAAIARLSTVRPPSANVPAPG